MTLTNATLGAPSQGHEHALSTGTPGLIGHRLISPEMEERIHKFRETWKVPGLQVTIVASPKYSSPAARNEDGTWRTHLISSGIRAVNGDKVTSDTLFAFASNGKAITVLALGKLIKESAVTSSGQKLSWDTKIKDLLPAFRCKDPDVQDNVTLLQFLSMQSGIPSQDWGVPQDATPAQQLELMKHVRLSAKLGEKWQYNNQHYHILPEAFTSLAGMTYEEYVKRHFLEPWGMNDITFNFQDAVDTGRLSESFMRKNGSLEACKKFKQMVPGRERDVVFQQALGEVGSAGYWSLGHPNTGLAAGGGLLMSGKDQAKFLSKLLDPQFAADSCLSEMTKKQIESDLQDPDIPELGQEYYGMAQQIRTYRGMETFGHWGSLPGQASRIIRIPDKGIAVMVSVNDDAVGFPFCRALSHILIDHLLDIKSDEPWEDRYAPSAIEAVESKLTHLPVLEKAESTPDVTGEYHDNGYGTLKIEKITDRDSILLRAAGVDSDTGKPQSEGYFAYVDKRFNSHLAFTHMHGPQWQWTATKVYPEYHADGSVSQDELTFLDLHGTCVFRDDGVGFFQNFWTQGPSLPLTQPNEEHTQENAEVWFKRV